MPLRLYFAEFIKAVRNCSGHGVVAARVQSERRGQRYKPGCLETGSLVGSAFIAAVTLDRLKGMENAWLRILLSLPWPKQTTGILVTTIHVYIHVLVVYGNFVNIMRRRNQSV